MNGKKAKRLRKMAEALLRKDGHKLGDGYREYNQAMNRIDWVPQLDNDGFPLIDPDGVPLMKPEQTPGTLTSAYKIRVLHQGLKRLSRDNPKL